MKDKALGFNGSGERRLSLADAVFPLSKSAFYPNESAENHSRRGGESAKYPSNGGDGSYLALFEVDESSPAPDEQSTNDVFSAPVQRAATHRRSKSEDVRFKNTIVLKEALSQRRSALVNFRCIFMRR
jgi:hypothetical protein